MTMKKAQNQAVDKLELYLPHPVFSYGQLCCHISS